LHGVRDVLLGAIGGGIAWGAASGAAEKPMSGIKGGGDCGAGPIVSDQRGPKQVSLLPEEGYSDCCNDILLADSCCMCCDIEQLNLRSGRARVDLLQTLLHGCHRRRRR
jgi:hypothetical protein